MTRLTTILALWFVLIAASTAQQVGFSAAPPRSGALHYRLELRPGESATRQVRIRNTSDIPLKFRVYEGQAFTGPNGALNGPLYGEPVTGVGTWLTPSTDGVALAPGARTDVEFTVQVPSGTPPGDHLGFIFVDIDPDSLPVQEEAAGDTPEDDKAKFRVQVNTRFGLAVVTRVPGEVEAGMVLGPVDKFIHDGRLGLRFTGENTGNVYIKPTGRWTLYGPDGAVVARRDREPWGTLLPGSELVREFLLDTDKPLVRGEYRFEVEANYQDPTAPEETPPRTTSKETELTLP